MQINFDNRLRRRRHILESALLCRSINAQNSNALDYNHNTFDYIIKNDQFANFNFDSFKNCCMQYLSDIFDTELIILFF